MPSREAMQIAEAQWEHALTGTGIVRRDGKVRDLARSIDALRVRDLEQLAKEQCWACKDGHPMKIMDDDLTVFHQTDTGTWNCDAQEVGEAIFALRAAMGEQKEQR